MGCSIKMIVKFGLIAEIITAIIGSIGEYSLRYQTYSSAMDELFGPYFDNNNIDNIDPELLKKIQNHDHYHHDHRHEEWPSNHQHYDHLTGESFQISELNAMANAIGQNNHRQAMMMSTFGGEETFVSKFFSRVSSWLFPQRLDPKTNKPINSIDSRRYYLDPRPLLVLSILILLNIVFILVVITEYLSLISVMAITWILYLIMMFVIVRVMNDSLAKMALQQDNLKKFSRAQFSQWSTLLPSPFIILIVIIIVLFSFILIALITEERRQIAARIRARSACIPLVKSRDMDLDDI